jgi:hypothetical protein
VPKAIHHIETGIKPDVRTYFQSKQLDNGRLEGSKKNKKSKNGKTLLLFVLFAFFAVASSFVYWIVWVNVSGHQAITAFIRI